MDLLAKLGLRQANPWEPPTALDKILDAPLQALVYHIYHLILFLRGNPLQFHKYRTRIAGKTPIKVVCLSDTHDRIPSSPVPAGDLLIHCGDLTDRGTIADIQKQLDFLAVQPHRHKVVICGNHDSYFDPKSRRDVDKEPGAVKLDFKGIHYLEHEAVTLGFDGGRKLSVYGAPDIPKCGGSDFAFQYDRGSPPWKGTIPMETDILVTHAPPRYHRDLGLGCAGLLEEVWRVRPRLHVFGHVHWGRGREAVYFDDCQRAYESVMKRRAGGIVRDLILPNTGWLDSLRVVYYGVGALFWKWIMQGPRSNDGSLMVNAACMYGNTGTLRIEQAEVVEL